MLARLGCTGARCFSSTISTMAVIGNNPKVPELMKQMGLTKYCTPIYFSSEEEMMKPASYDSALIVSSNPQQMEKFLSVQKSIKWVHSTMAGVDWVLGDTLRNSDIILTNAKGAFSKSLAEYILFGILYHAKLTPYFLEQREKQAWAPTEVEYVQGKKVGIIGYGHIGYTTARLLKQAFNTKILACTENKDKIPKRYLQFCDELIEAKDYEKVLRTTDYVVGILPKTKSTENYFDLEKFKMMRPSSVFLNIGRGVTMVEKDLITALNEKIISGAVLDVFPQEPLPSTSELYKMKNVLMTYHCADKTADYWERTMTVFANELYRYVHGMKPKNLIKKDLGYQP
eukprot:TRINITY_DN3646_c0_g1_i1.p1 TRINITY_DN3646_c0_g1~~TRINITY_DN3646_c0_g1_i1.p1  ORF type:complete len:342 (-),score=35.81 TRINITY_DN3646_c0_g1_i1:67-1092(-)